MELGPFGAHDIGAIATDAAGLGAHCAQDALLLVGGHAMGMFGHEFGRPGYRRVPVPQTTIHGILQELLGSLVHGYWIMIHLCLQSYTWRLILASTTRPGGVVALEMPFIVIQRAKLTRLFIAQVHAWAGNASHRLRSNPLLFYGPALA